MHNVTPAPQWVQSASGQGTLVPLPASACSNMINFAGFIAFFCAVFFCRHMKLEAMPAAVLCVGVYGFVIIALEVLILRTPWRASTGLDFSRRNWSADRVFTKLIGLYGVYALIALLYWQFPIYHEERFGVYWGGLSMCMPFVLILAIPYVAFVDMHMKQPEDSYYQFGRLILTLRYESTGLAMRQFLLMWVVKAYFLPIMFVYMVWDIHFLCTMDLSDKTITFLHLFPPVVTLIFLLDLVAANAGYAMTFRLFDTHIRSVEPTFIGWLVCLMCYDPFNGIYLGQYAAYRGGHDRWIEWASGSPYLTMMWGSLAALGIFVYSVAGLNFGVRFSNLTHRGVLTNGMFRYTKHPEYLCKNFYWWMIYVPFAAVNDGGDWIDSLRWMTLMLMVNVVYFMRARTEEWHMSRDPVYVQYALWMNEHAALAWLGRLIPFFRYRPPEGWEKQPAPYMGIK